MNQSGNGVDGRWSHSQSDNCNASAFQETLKQNSLKPNTVQALMTLCHSEDDVVVISDDKIDELVAEFGIKEGQKGLLIKFINDKKQTYKQITTPHKSHEEFEQGYDSSKGMDPGQQFLRVAVVGQRHAGKSSLINALRGRKPRDADAACTDLGVRQSGVCEYPLFGNMTLVELPVAISKSPDYLDKYKYFNFDAIVVCSAERLTEWDVWLVDEARKNNIKCFVLRTKIDRDVESDKQDYEERHDEKSLLSRIRNDIRGQLTEIQDQSEVFLLSNKEKYRSFWNFQFFKDKLLAFQRTYPGKSTVNHDSPPADVNTIRGDNQMAGASKEKPAISDQQEHYVQHHGNQNTPITPQRDRETVRHKQTLTDTPLSRDGSLKQAASKRQNNVKVAILGEGGTGKSSLINALLGLKPTDRGAACVNVTASHSEVREYQLTENIQLVEMNVNASDDYSGKDKLTDLDVIVVCSAGRLRELDVQLAKTARKRNLKCYFVRTKIDVDIKSDREDYGDQHEKKLLGNIKNDIKSQLEKINRQAEIFLLSSKSIHRSEWDFEEFKTKLLESKKRGDIVNVVFVGAMNSGQLRLIEALGGIKPREMTTTDYYIINSMNVRLFNVDAANLSYSEEFSGYDVIVVCIAGLDKHTKTDVQLLKKAMASGKECLVVYTEIRFDSKATGNQKGLPAKFKEQNITQLVDGGHHLPVFLLSDVEDFRELPDFRGLRQKICKYNERATREMKIFIHANNQQNSHAEPNKINKEPGYPGAHTAHRHHASEGEQESKREVKADQHSYPRNRQRSLLCGLGKCTIQ